jgi:hypothetical protein
MFESSAAAGAFRNTRARQTIGQDIEQLTLLVEELNKPTPERMDREELFAALLAGSSSNLATQARAGAVDGMDVHGSKPASPKRRPAPEGSARGVRNMSIHNRGGAMGVSTQATRMGMDLLHPFFRSALRVRWP